MCLMCLQCVYNVSTMCFTGKMEYDAVDILPYNYYIPQYSAACGVFTHGISAARGREI